MNKIVVQPALWMGHLLALVTLVSQVSAQAMMNKPRVPPGVDPGGVAVAIIGSGIDYTNPEIAKRLARDGEGEIIGWDFLDSDRRPYQRCSRAGAVVCAPTMRDRLAAMEGVRFIAMRAAVETPHTLVRAVQAIAQTPARIVLIATETPPPLEFLVEAARRHPDIAFFGPVAKYATSPGQPVGSTYFGLAIAPDIDGDHADKAGIFIAYVGEAVRCSRKSPDAPASDVLKCALGRVGEKLLTK